MDEILSTGFFVFHGAWMADGPGSVGRDRGRSRWRADEGNRLALVAAIDAEVFPVRGDHRVMRVKLTHADQTQIGQIRPAIGVAFGQAGQMREVLAAVKRQRDQPVGDECQRQVRVAEVKRGLRDNRLTRQEWLGHVRREPHRPGVMGVVSVGKGDQEPGVGDAFADTWAEAGLDA